MHRASVVACSVFRAFAHVVLGGDLQLTFGSRRSELEATEQVGGRLEVAVSQADSPLWEAQRAELTSIKLISGVFG